MTIVFAGIISSLIVLLSSSLQYSHRLNGLMHFNESSGFGVSTTSSTSRSFCIALGFEGFETEPTAIPKSCSANSNFLEASPISSAPIFVKFVKYTPRRLMNGIAVFHCFNSHFWRIHPQWFLHFISNLIIPWRPTQDDHQSTYNELLVHTHIHHHFS